MKHLAELETSRLKNELWVVLFTHILERLQKHLRHIEKVLHAFNNETNANTCMCHAANCEWQDRVSNLSNFLFVQWDSTRKQGRKLFVHDLSRAWTISHGFFQFFG